MAGAAPYVGRAIGKVANRVSESRVGQAVSNSKFGQAVANGFRRGAESVTNRARSVSSSVKGWLTRGGGSVAEGAADATSDHIVLGLRAHGLEETATKVGGRTMLSDPEWMSTLQRAVVDPSTKFTVSLDGLGGSSTYSQIASAVQRGASGIGGYTDWELSLLYDANRLGGATFVRGGVPVENPWAP